MIFQKKNKIRKYAITRKFPQLLDENDVFLHKKKREQFAKFVLNRKWIKKTKYLETLEWLGFLVKTSAIANLSWMWTSRIYCDEKPLNILWKFKKNSMQWIKKTIEYTTALVRFAIFCVSVAMLEPNLVFPKTKTTPWDGCMLSSVAKCRSLFVSIFYHMNW